MVNKVGSRMYIYVYNASTGASVFRTRVTRCSVWKRYGSTELRFRYGGQNTTALC
jgi:hypothetical protein